MGKKQRRKQQSFKTGAQAPAPVTSAPTPQSPVSTEARRASATSAVASRAKPGATWLEFREQYRHVNAELKQIGIIAGSFLVVLLVLTAILN